MARNGRPCRLDDMVEGTDKTVRELIVARIRTTGCTARLAAATVGIPAVTLHGWVKEGETAEDIVRKGRRALSEGETRSLSFLVETRQAWGEWESGMNVLHAQVARGGIPLITETVKIERQVDPETGVVREVEIERTRRASATIPDAKAIEWELSRKGSDNYRERVEVTAELVGDSVSDRAAGLVAEILAYRQGRDDVAAESASAS